MFDGLTIRLRIILTILAVLTLMVVMSGFAYVQLAHIDRQAGEMQRETQPGLDLSTQTMDAWGDQAALDQAHVTLDNADAIRNIEAQIEAGRRRADSLMKRYEEGIRQAQDRINFGAATAACVQYRALEDDLLTASRAGRRDDVHRIMTERFEPLAAKVQSALQVVQDYNRRAVDKGTSEILSAIGVAELGIGLSLLVALVLAAISGYLLLRAITRPLYRLTALVDNIGRGNFSERVAIDRADEFGTLGTGFNRMIDDLTGLIGEVQKSSIQVNTSITEVAATSKQQQTTASEIAATTTEIGATSREIATTSRELVRTMEEVSGVAEQTAGLAGSGQAGLARMNEMMREVVEAAGAINAKLGLLNEKAANVTQVVTTITKVADQTNLLSLNASIEAEKAGEYGRGFAVVATEIRRLADQTAVATYDIEQMVKDIQSAVSAGVVGMDKFSETVRVGMRDVSEVGGQLSQIVTQVQGLVPHFEIVNEGMQAQATGAGQISEALGQLGEVATQTVDSLRQSNLAVDSLKDVSSALRESVSRFRLQAS
ncbi:methyl-accepting chemotaxis protein WspA [Sphingomonas sp. YR710]|jgi:methyl-accepting chemotaxis protein WspA|uniref:methyl-accepting chemotaxis protein n=1 Tax=Sphingomonas sp. YR710 TaxID=1882773 RepID=UPI0008887406|nr:methyl-accepting chemotaxis protein [Sphingomonas sp. YR710]SDD05428.1 methyl-accepting chemotaxis protein WspA [Sphingomonas sp. YR710]